MTWFGRNYMSDNSIGLQPNQLRVNFAVVSLHSKYKLGLDFSFCHQDWNPLSSDLAFNGGLTECEDFLWISYLDSFILCYWTQVIKRGHPLYGTCFRQELYSFKINILTNNFVISKISFEKCLYFQHYPDPEKLIFPNYHRMTRIVSCLQSSGNSPPSASPCLACPS